MARKPANSSLGPITAALMRGARWSTASLLVISTVQILRVIVLGRILGPDAFGLLAMMLIFISLFELLIQFGLGDAIIQQDSPSDLQRSTLYWTNVLLGIACYAGFWFATPWIADLYSTPELETYLPWIATTFLIRPWGAQIASLLQKKLEFSPQAVIDACGAIVGTAVAIALAVAGAGVWSLVTGHVVHTAIATVGLLAVGRANKLLPRLEFDLRRSAALLEFGAKITMSNLIAVTNARVDQFLIGYMLGSTALGFYSMAFNLVVDPFTKLNGVVTKLAFPALSRIKADRSHVRSAYFRMLDLLSTLYTPLLLGAILLAGDAIPLFLGSQWEPAIPVVQLLAVFALFRSINGAGASVVLSLGHPGRLFIWNLILILSVPIWLFVCIRSYGLIGAAIGQVVLQVSLVSAWYVYCVRPLVGSSLRGYLGALLPSLVLGSAMCVGLLAMLAWWPTERPAVGRIVLAVLAGAAIYTLLNWRFRREFSTNVLRLVFPGR